MKNKNKYLLITIILVFTLLTVMVINLNANSKEYIIGDTDSSTIQDESIADDAEKENMGLTTWKNAPDGKILETDVTIAKNYLSQEEIIELNNLVSMYLDYAERQVKLGKIISMQEWKEKLEVFLKINEYNILKDNGKIKREIADKLALDEYKKYRIIQDRLYKSDFDKFLELEDNTKDLEK